MSQTTNPYVPGGKNKIIWGDEVTGGSSGGNVSYNAETGKLHYIQGYENDPKPTAAAVSGLQAAAPGSDTLTKTRTQSKPKASAPKPASTTAPKPAAPKVPAPSMPTPVSGAPVANTAGGGGGAAPAMEDGSSGESGLSGMLASLSGQQPPPVPFTPQFGPGLRAGLGQRAYPVRNLALAGLRTIY